VNVIRQQRLPQFFKPGEPFRIRLSECPYLALVPASKNSLWRFEVECDGFDPAAATVVCQTYEMDALCSAAHCARAVKTFGYGRGRFASINVVTGQLVI
jgi:hypothetical protein